MTTTKRRRWWPLLLLPYFIGLIWTCLHPILSIITGELKCRGAFIDENSLDPSHFRLDPSAGYGRMVSSSNAAQSLCQALDNVHLNRGNVECVESSNSQFHVAKIEPISHIAASAETIAIVVPSFGKDWREQTFQNAILHLVTRLASHKATPWLAKTILIVGPTKSTGGDTLQSTVDAFLDAYLGTKTPGGPKNETLPLQLTSGMLRQLLVLHVEVKSTDDQNNDTPIELQVLPQGRRGLLPNMDLVFVTTTLYGRMPSMLPQRTTRKVGDRGVLRVHPYGAESQKWRASVDDSLRSFVSPFVKNWLYELGDLLLFGKSLLIGPFQPHASALDRGVDSLTLRLSFHGQPSATRVEHQQAVVDYVQTTELLLRTLSNLHERLHHSITQYLLPSPTKFVSHAEYLIPNLLLLLPLTTRAITFLFVDIPRFDLTALQSAAGVMGISALLPVASGYFEETAMAALYAVIYAFLVHYKVLTPAKDPQSLQFVTCLLAIYLHVPLLLGHIALCWPSAVLWSLMLAILPSSQGKGARNWLRLVMWTLLIIIWPPSFLVPRVLGSYTPYALFVYAPLHFLLTIQWTM